jgi:uncharacterized membrane protein YhhN
VNDTPVGILVYFAVSAMVSLLVHSRIRRFFTACLACFILGPVAFTTVCAFRGEDVPVPPIGVVLFFATLSLLMAIVIGLPFWFVRRKNRRVST